MFVQQFKTLVHLFPYNMLRIKWFSIPENLQLTTENLVMKICDVELGINKYRRNFISLNWMCLKNIEIFSFLHVKKGQHDAMLVLQNSVFLLPP